MMAAGNSFNQGRGPRKGPRMLPRPALTPAILVALFLALAPLLMASPAYAAPALTCQTPCFSGSPCACAITTCDSGTLVITDSTRNPVGAVPISTGSTTWVPPAPGTFQLQANCAGSLSNVMSLTTSVSGSTTVSSTTAASSISSSSTTTPGCSCGDFVDRGCGLGCPAGYMNQTRTCQPAGCLSETTCTLNAACSGNATTTTTIYGNGTTTTTTPVATQVCGDHVCYGAENYFNCCADCAGCANTYCSLATQGCIEPYDLSIDIPTTIYYFSQFLLSPKQVLDRSTSLPIDSYTLCWQASCDGLQIANLGCNKNVFSIPASSPTCINRLSALLSVNGTLYTYEYPVKYLQQLKIFSSIFPSSVAVKVGDPYAEFTLTIQNLDTKQTDIRISSPDGQVLIGGNTSYILSLPSGASGKVAVRAPPANGTYAVQMEDANARSEVQTQQLVVRTTEVAGGGAVPQLFFVDASTYFSVEGGRRSEAQAYLKNVGGTPANFSLYAKGPGASAVSFEPSDTVSVFPTAQALVTVVLQPTFSTNGEYAFSACASPVSGGQESCVPATLNVTSPVSGRFDLGVSVDRVEIGVSDAFADVTVSLALLSNTTHVTGSLDTTCPAGVVTASWLNGKEIPVVARSYTNTVRVSPKGTTLSCSFGVVVSDQFGSQREDVSVSITPSFSEVSSIVDTANRAEALIQKAENEVIRMKATGKDPTQLQLVVSDARSDLSACRSQVSSHDYDQARIVCNQALEKAETALAVSRYSEVAAQINAPGKSLNLMVIAGVAIVLISTTVLLFGRFT